MYAIRSYYEIDHGREKFAVERLPVLAREYRAALLGNAKLFRFRLGETREAHAEAKTDERDIARSYNFV